MKKKSTRVFYTIIAVSIGVILILFFTNVGNNSKGPLEDLLVKVGSWVDQMDNKIVTKRNSKNRAKSMKWFDKYRNDPSYVRNPEQILLGAFDNHTEASFQSILDIENSIDQKFPLVHIYSAWGSEPIQRFPLQKIKAIYSLGSVPVLTWEPWLNDFDRDEHPHLKQEEVRDINGLRDISNGAYDFYLKMWVEDLKKYNKTIFIRFAHEMNDPYRYTWGPQNNTPEDFVKAWRHLVDFFRKEGAENVVWIWSPHIAYGQFESYYPGDDYVDWIGVGTLNYGNVAIWSDWWSFDEVYGNYYSGLTVFNKPVMLTEFGSLAVGGNRQKWYQDALCTLPEKYPLTKAVLFFHYDNDITLTNKSLNWYFKNDTILTQNINQCVNSWSN